MTTDTTPIIRELKAIDAHERAGQRLKQAIALLNKARDDIHNAHSWGATVGPAAELACDLNEKALHDLTYATISLSARFQTTANHLIATLSSEHENLGRETWTALQQQALDEAKRTSA